MKIIILFFIFLLAFSPAQAEEMKYYKTCTEYFAANPTQQKQTLTPTQCGQLYGDALGRFGLYGKEFVIKFFNLSIYTQEIINEHA